ncbi:YkgB family protein [Halosquirtibacter xylanolyticus]|uniref:YkgB family protein n=1 Tax=Halosquirtibacter xylanolyticus TaxID=3374599 RepID=UPI0037499179|nr:YkgB family protein [Prolixibacteraceae bacterium]
MDQSKRVTAIGENVERYGLVLILLWYGIFKFTPTEAEAIVPLVKNSPFMSWMLHLFSVQVTSNIIGSAEIITALALAVGPWKPKIGLVGGILSTLTFLATLSFLFSSPGMFKLVDNMYVPNGFILKDLMLLGFSIWATGDAMRRIKESI